MPYHDTATRAQALTLKILGHPYDVIEAHTGIKRRTVNDILTRAIDRGFDPDSEHPTIRDSYVEDAAKSSRPSKQTDEAKKAVLAKVRKDRYGREKTCASIAQELGTISSMTVWRILRKAGLKKTKPTRKPGLTEQMKLDRLEWCQRHAHWTLEDWKKVIWSDETSVVLLHRRGGYRVWRSSDERFVRSCIRERWKGYSEFMFWGCFSYDKKGPCHIWKPETKKEKEKAEKELEKLNAELEPIMKEEWELNTGMKRLGLRAKGGLKPQWKWTKKTGKLARGSKGGIDWYRYQQEVLIPKLLPFAKECGPEALVQEDRAPAHAHHAQALVYSQAQVARLLWVPNSPDLNMIEPCWPYLKRVTTKTGAPKSKAEAERVWKKAWNDMEQEKIQAWIQRIEHHIQEVIRLDGGNEYKEGRAKDRR